MLRTRNPLPQPHRMPLRLRAGRESKIVSQQRATLAEEQLSVEHAEQAAHAGVPRATCPMGLTQGQWLWSELPRFAYWFVGITGDKSVGNGTTTT